MRRQERAVGIWLATCAVLVFAMIVVGGITRITRSGLSITTWDPVTGVLPPMSDAAWGDAFARYQASPEGMRVNAGMTQGEFQSIYYVEWGHRLLGRIVGFVVAVPLIVFLVRRNLAYKRALPMIGLLLAGAAQGALGWYMVKSGLVSEPRVSPFRLAAHLLLGMALLGWLVWAAYGELAPPHAAMTRRARPLAIVSLGFAGLTVGYGALMAGHHAGLLSPTFPTMNGEWLPAQVHLGSARALLADAWTVHFVHRALAYATALMVLATAWFAWRRATIPTRVVALGLVSCVGLQITLGALLVLRHVPATLAVLHQANAALIVVFLVGLLRETTLAATDDISQTRCGPTTQESVSEWVSPSSKAPMRAFLRTIRSRRRWSARPATTPHF